MKIKKKTKQVLKIYIFLTTILCLAYSIGLFSNINQELTDSLHNQSIPSKNIIIIGIDDNSIQKIGRWPWPRSKFATIINQLDNVKAIGLDISFFEPSTPEEDNLLSDSIKNSNKVFLSAEITNFDPENNQPNKTLAPLDKFQENAQGVGYINILLDEDGTNRRFIFNASKDFPAFSEEIYKQNYNINYDSKDDEKIINFAGTPQSYKIYSFIDILQNKIPRQELENKIVLIGATAPDLHDEYIVPTSKGSHMSGAEIQANILQNLILDNWLKEQSSSSLLLLLILSGLLLFYLFSKIKIRYSTPLLLGVIIIYVLCAIFIAQKYKIILNLIYPPLNFSCVYFGNIIYFYAHEKQNRKKILKAFRKYVSPEIVREIMKRPKKLKLGGEKRTITIMFSDIRNFTHLSEQLDPQEILSLLNKYFSEMTNIIIKRKGCIDKYIGDAIMAFWGAPVHHKNHAILACQTALKMKNHLNFVLNKLQLKGFPKFNIGIGLNTGSAVIGNLGGNKRFDYTAIGDCVNLASRIEGLTKEYGVKILISENTYKQINNHFMTRKVDLVAVKGKKKPIWVYELICRKNSSAKTKKLIQTHSQALNLYLNRKWELAIKKFNQVLKIKPRDQACLIFINRCEQFIKNSPSKNWNGIWVMKKK